METGTWKFNKSNNSPLEIYEKHVKSEKKILSKWKIISYITIAGFVASLIVMTYAINLPRTVPVLITMNDFGETKVIGEINKISYSGLKIPDIAIESRIRTFVSNYYTIPSDSEVLKKNMIWCYSCLTGNSSTKLSTYLKNKNNPFEEFGKIKQSVKIESVLNVSKNSYQIDFIVNRNNIGGMSKGEQYMRGIFTVVTLEPNDDDKLDNPLGIYFRDFDFTKVEKSN